jgi:hypothetical protein
MNYFVIIVDEEQGGYYTSVPHPVRTLKSKDQLIAAAGAWYNTLPVNDNPRFVDQRGCYRNRNQVWPVPGSTLRLAVHDLETCVPVGEQTFRYYFKPPVIMDLQEWFDTCPQEGRV